jgi:hypothetical protein
MNYVDGCQQLDNIYFRGVKQCKYVTGIEGEQNKLELNKQERIWK